MKQILTSGNALKSDRSNYADNYRFFRVKLVEFKSKTPDNLDRLAARLLRNVYVILEEAHTEKQALQVFVTGNDRGMPLQIEDIFQAKLYEYIKNTGDDKATTAFVDKWKSISERCKGLFDSDKNLSPIEFAFLLYAITRHKGVTWKNLNDVYSVNDYALLKSPQTLKNIEALLDFLATVHATGKQLVVPDSIAQKAYILFRCSKTTPWYLMTKYYFAHRDKGGDIFNEEFDAFLERAVAYFVRSAVSADVFDVTRARPVLKVIPRLMDGDIPDDLKISEVCIRSNLNHSYELKSLNRIRQIIANWWTFKDVNQPRVPWKTKLEVEHIFAKSRVSNCAFGNPNNVELPGNLSLLESTNNRKATNFTFAEKHNVYSKSHNIELRQLSATKDDFTEDDIIVRNQQIITAVIALLDKTGFLQK